ncbi:hypothetical protein DB30_08043 [Enhygromyxa salina]|uniref:Uncharacterized protein n=1 Tax=Enhygromyxa salina TaxID=215803 RepID=A0A0C2D007_9BACT|nr:hypothetical protein [Enhygromyxa salina]KIG13477.1 hypothetical protein DB30_08043 [Enhygromyxa salina]
MSETQALLDEVKKLQVAQDGAALKQLEDHADKKVRKAARKAIHVLRAKGIEIPEQARSWNEASTQSMRGHAGPIAMLDMAASPGVTRMTLSLPNEDDGAALFVALIDPSDRLLNFAAYYQTDGQQSRTGRDWQRDADGRVVSPAWVAARLWWAREQTHRSNFQLPAQVDEHLPTLTKFLGTAPGERPQPSFLDEALAEVEASTEDLGNILMVSAVHTWPLLFDANALFEDLGNRMEGLEAASITNEDRLAHIVASSKDDEGLRTGLRGPLANALDDVAVILFLDGSLADARRVRDLTTALRTADAPESVEGVVNLVQLQLTSAAMQQLRDQGGQQDHDHDHDHDHGHVHDENCDHDHD